MNSRDSLERVDFDDPQIIAAIKKAAEEFDEDAPHIRKRLEQFETTVHESAWTQVYP